MNRVDIQIDNPQGEVRIVFAHGAGAGLRSDFMQFVALGLAMHGFEVVRFNFPYWQQFVDTGTRRPPNPMPQLCHAMQHVVEEVTQSTNKPLILMGKSMGARVAFQTAIATQPLTCVGLGFPFHPPGKPDKTRLSDLANPCRNNLVLQGDRDSFGKPAEVASYPLPTNVTLHWLLGGDHSFTPTKRSGLNRDQLWQQAIDLSAAHIQQQLT